LRLEIFQPRIEATTIIAARGREHWRRSEQQARTCNGKTRAQSHSQPPPQHHLNDLLVSLRQRPIRWLDDLAQQFANPHAERLATL
jgi:hypothetical protein